MQKSNNPHQIKPQIERSSQENTYKTTNQTKQSLKIQEEVTKKNITPWSSLSTLSPGPPLLTNSSRTLLMTSSMTWMYTPLVVELAIFMTNPPKLRPNVRVKSKENYQQISKLIGGKGYNRSDCCFVEV